MAPVWRLSALLLSLLLIAGCEPQPGGALRMGLATPPGNLDPRFATDAVSERINRLLYRRLVELDEEGHPQPSLAHWQRVAPNHYRFLLGREGRRFADGSRLRARDVKATYDTVLDAANASPHRGLLSIVAHIDTLGEDRVDFHLKRPDPLFPAYLNIGIEPAALIERGHPFHRRPVGSGPFRFEAWPAPGRLLLERRRDGQRLEFLVAGDPSVRVLKLLRGEIDMLQNDLPPELFGYLQRRPEVRVWRRPGTNFSYLGFNLQDPDTGRREVRRAIAHAIDRAAIVRYVLNGAATPAQSLFPARHWAGVDLPGYAFDPPRARALLRAAGYDADHPLRLRYKTSADPFRVRLASVIQAQLADVGIEVALRSYDWGTFFGDIKAGRFQMYSLAWVGIKTPEIFRYAFHSGSMPPRGANRGRYRNPEADRLIARAETLPLDRRPPLYQALQRLLLRDLPYVPLWYEDQIAACRRDIKGYRLSADGDYDGLDQVFREARDTARGSDG